MTTTVPSKRRLSTRVRPVIFRHPLSDLLPGSMQELVQDNVLEALFRDALLPNWQFPALAQVINHPGRISQSITMTRTGLMAPATTPIVGDPADGSYGKEQWTARFDQYGNTLPTNLLGSAVGVASIYARDVQTLGTNGGSSLNQIARNALYATYAGGRTWCRTTAGADTSIQVNSVDGFTHVLVDGVPTAVSAGTPLNITINGVANTVTGVNAGTRTLTLGTSTADTAGHPVVSLNAPVSLRPNAKATAFNLLGTDLATVGLYFDAVARLRNALVPPAADGLYEAHVNATTMRQLLSDAEFRQAFESQGGSAEYRQGQITIFGGIRFVMNQEVPVIPASTDGTAVPANRTIVCGAEPLVALQLEDQHSIREQIGASGNSTAVSVMSLSGFDIGLIGRAPLDKLQQVVQTTWSWVGGFAVPTDSVSGDAALAKRCVVVEHA